LEKLTPREGEVFELVVRGRMNNETAYELTAIVRTIKAHRRVMKKLLAELVSAAERLGASLALIVHWDNFFVC
jgi:FixJ family two-component response regulator